MPRRLAISDIHGCARTFAALLDELQLSPSDELYLLGDFVDRGPRSRQVIEATIDLQRRGYRVKCLRGNHDQYMIDGFTDKQARQHWKSVGGKATRKSYVSELNPEGRVPEEHREWLAALPYYFDTGDYYLVHAGFNFRRKNPLKGKKAMLTARYYYPRIDVDWLAGRYIVHGHTPATKTAVAGQVSAGKRLYPVFGIDAGCFHTRPDMGHLCAFDLDYRQFTFVTNQDR